jgi:hypothetical protein
MYRVLISRYRVDAMQCTRTIGGFLVASSLCATLASCDGLPIINASYNGSYSGREWAGHDLPVVVRGSPFAVPPAELNQAITDALADTTFGETRFVGAPNGSTAVYRVIFVFAPPPGLADFALCTLPEPPNVAPREVAGSRVEVLAALCRGDTAISSADGRVQVGSGPASSEFRRSVAQVGTTLFPARNPEKSVPEA